MKVFNVERRPKGRMLARWLGVFIGLVCFAVILPGDRDRGSGESVTTLSHGGTKRVPELVSESNPPSTVTTLGRTPIVIKGDVVVANLRMFLNKGVEVTAEYPESSRAVIDMSQRETIAGIRYGIEGLRAGGKRTFTISHHLAYGDIGLGE